MSKNLVKSVKPDYKPNEVLFGKTKVFMSDEFHRFIEKA